MTTILINTASCNSDYTVQLSDTYSLGTYVTLRDNGSNPSFFTSNSIVIVATSGYTFYDGSQVQYIRKSGDFLTFAAMTSSWRLVNTAAYSASGNALLSNASTTNLFIYGELSLSNLITGSLTATGGIDIETPPTVQGIPVANTTDLVSTVVGLGSFGYFSSVSFMNSSFVSTVVGLGGYGYISTPQLLSTVGGLGSLGYVSSAHLTSTFQGLGSYYISTPSLLSTVGNLGTFGYISTSWLASTVGGLGSFMPSPYISTTQLFSTVSNSLQNTSSNNQSTFANLGGLYVSSASLVSTIRDMSNLYVTYPQFESTTAGIGSNYTPATNSTIAGLGSTYISSLSLVSTTVSLAASNQSTVANKLSSLGSVYISSASLLSTVAGLGTYGHISLSQLISTTSGALSLNSSNLASTVAGLGNSYVSTGGLVSTTIGIGAATDITLASTVAGLGSPPFSLVSSSALQSTVAGLGTSYISLAHLISTTSNLAAGELSNVNSTIAGLASIGYISTTQLQSTVSGISATNRSNLISTVNTLGLTYISSSGLQSTVAGLGSFGYVSLSQLTSTTSNLAIAQCNTINSTLAGLGTSYISTAHLVSTVTGFSNTNQTNLISTVNTLGQTYISSTGLQSTVAGLGSFGYVSLSQLTSTTSNVLAGSVISVTSTIAGLGSVGYVSTTQLNSTVQGISLTHDTTLISTVNNIGSYPGFISSLALRSTVAGLGTYGHISLSQLTSTTAGLNQTVVNDMTSTTNGLGSLGYISTAHIVSTVQGFSNTTRVSLISTVNTLSNVTTAQLTSTQNGLGTFTTTGQVDSASNDLNNSFQNIYNSTIAGLGSYYISTAHVVSTVTGINSIQDQRMTSTTNTLGSSVPAYISTAHLVSSYIGVTGVGNLVLENLTSTTSNFESGSYGTTSTVEGLGLLGYISTAQLVSTVLGYSNSTGLNLISTVNTLGTSAGSFVSSASLQSTVAGLGTTYISLAHLVSTTVGLPPPTVRPDSMTNAVNTLAGTYTYISSLSLQSSVAGLGSPPFSYISTLSLASTVAGLGTFGYLSTGYLVSTFVGSSNPMTPFTSTTAGLGSAGYISTSGLSNIVPDAYSVTTFASVVFPEAIAITSNYIYYTGGNNIYRNTFDGKQQTIFYTSNTSFTTLACDLSNVYTALNRGNQILSISMNTSVATVLANTTNNPGYTDGKDPSQVQFNSICSLSIDPGYKFLYICEYNNYFLRRLQFSNGNSLFNVTTLSNFTINNPRHIAVDSLNENLYVGTVGTGIFKYSLVQNNLIVLKAQTPSHEGKFFGVSIDPTEKFAYAADNYTNSLYSINLTSGNLTLLAGSGTAGYKDGNGSNAMFNIPQDCVYNPYDSCVYIADSNNNAIRKITTTLYASTIAGLNASAVVQRITASNSTLAYPQHGLSSNFITSAAVLPSIPGLRLWLDGADPLATGIVLSNGTPVPSWIDKSGNGFNGTASGTPTYSNGIINNSWGFNTTLNANMTNQTVFAVYTTTSASTSQTIVGGFGQDNSSIEVGLNGGSNQINLGYPANNPSGSYTTDIIRTIAGSNGNSGQTDGTGSNARFNGPNGLVIDSSANVYVADTLNHAIRKITPSGVVTTFAGTMGSAGFTDDVGINARFNSPFGLAIDPSGNIYVSDMNNYRIRKITPSGSVSTLAGNGSPGITNGSSTTATFNQPYGISSDFLGNVYVAEYANNIIRRIDTAGNVTTFAGTGAAGASNSLVEDSTFNQPYALACDNYVNVFVGDRQNNMIRKIAPLITMHDLNRRFESATINTVTGEMYFTRYFSRTIFTYNSNTSPSYYVCATIPNAVTSNQPWGIVYDINSGLTFACDERASVLYRVTPGTPTSPGTCTIVAGSNFTSGYVDGAGIPTARFNRPRELTSSPGFPDTIFIGDSGTNLIRMYTISTGQVSTLNLTNVPVYEEWNINGIALTNDGTRLYMTYLANRTVYYATLKPSISSTVTFFAGGFSSPIGICVDSLGKNIFVGDTLDRDVKMFSSNGSYIRSLGILSQYNIDAGLVINSNGVIYVGSGHAIFRPSVSTLATGINNILSLTIDSSSNLYAGVPGEIEKITPAGAVSTFVGNGTQGYVDGNFSSAQINSPGGLVWYSGNIYFSESTSHTIRSSATVRDIVIGGTVTTSTQLFTSVVQMGVYNGVTGYLNGSLVSQGSIFYPFLNSATVTIGSAYRSDILYTTPFTGTIHEIIIYNTALNTTQRQAVEFYLQQKWIQSSWQASYAGKSNTTTQRITFQNGSITINPNLYATTITAATFTASMSKGGTASNGFFKGDSTKVTNISDRRLKYDICPIENALEKVSSMQAVRYRLYRDPSQAWIGYVAQDLEVILPEVVRTDGEGWKSIQYSTLPALIIEAVKELNEKYEKIKYLLSTST